MSEKPVTLREVARRANVSVATVSYVLSGKGRMALETRRGIEAMLREAGIRPRYKRHPVFYLSDHREFRDTHAFEPFLQLYDGMNASLHEAEVNLRIEFLHLPNAGPLRTQLQMLLSYRPGGIIIDGNLRDEVEEIGEYFEKERIPTVQVGHTVRAPNIDAVVVDSFGGAYAATRHLIRRGHERIAIIRWNVAGDPASSKKLAGYQCALNELGRDVRPDYVVESAYTRLEGMRQPARIAVEQLLALPEPPTAVFVENSFISPPLIYPNEPAEKEVPKAIRDLDIVHFEAWNLAWMEQVMAGKLCFPARSTKLMRINWEELGRTAGKHLMARIEGAERNGQVLQLVPALYHADGDVYTSLQL